MKHQLIVLITMLVVSAAVGASPVYEGEGGAQYVGKDACQTCHEGQYDEFIRSGHAYKLNEVVDGKAPEYPFTELPELPEGVTWDDVSYVIGGYNWKARFVGQDGYIITGAEGDTTYLNQYNFANPDVGNEAGWAKYHPGEKRPYSCGPCHTTGYRGDPDTHQDDRPGIVGTWAEPGITCEECHGPGSLHVASPYGVKLRKNVDSELCAECHYRGAIEVVDVSGGFIKHHEQYEELFQSKHIALDCTVCHDPHLGVIQLRKDGVATTRTNCANCHFEQEKYQASAVHESVGLACIDCHMPRLSKSAVGNKEKFTGDLRTHLMAIDPELVQQFTNDGKNTASQLGLDFACRSCHSGPGMASDKSDQELMERAWDYHARPTKM